VSGVAEKHKFVFTGRWIPEKGDSGQLFSSFKYWATPNLGVGFDYRPLVDDISLTATYRLISEDPTGWRPAIILGTGVDDFTQNGVDVNSRSYFVTVSKALRDHEFLGISPAPYAGAAFIEELDKIRFLAGVSFRHEHASLIVQYSGTDTHLTLSRTLNDNVSVSAIYWGMEYPGLGMRIRF